MGAMKQVYIDSCMAIYAVESAADQGPAVTRLLNEHRATSVYCVSDMVRLECRVLPLRDNKAELLEEYSQFFSMMNDLPITSEVFELATELRARHGLKTPDALHAACAIHHGCREFWTNDNRLAAIGERITIRIPA